MKWLLAPLSMSLLAALAAAGCTLPDYPQYHQEVFVAEGYPAHYQPGDRVRSVGGGDVLQDVKTGELFVAPPPQQPLVVYVPYDPTREGPAFAAPAPAPLPPRVTRPDPVHQAFDAPSALASIHGVDASSCVAHGAPKGYAHVRVTFDGSGRATRVLIDEPAGLSGGAVDCLGDRIGRASARPFDGSPVTVGAKLYVG